MARKSAPPTSATVDDAVSLGVFECDRVSSAVHTAGDRHSAKVDYVEAEFTDVKDKGFLRAQVRILGTDQPRVGQSYEILIRRVASDEGTMGS